MFTGKVIVTKLQKVYRTSKRPVIVDGKPVFKPNDLNTDGYIPPYFDTSKCQNDVSTSTSSTSTTSSSTTTTTSQPSLCDKLVLSVGTDCNYPNVVMVSFEMGIPDLTIINVEAHYLNTIIGSAFNVSVVQNIARFTLGKYIDGDVTFVVTTPNCKKTFTVPISCVNSSTTTSTTTTSTSSSTTTTTKAPEQCSETFGVLSETPCDDNFNYGVLLEQKSGAPAINLIYGYGYSPDINTAVKWQEGLFMIVPGDGKDKYFFVKYGIVHECNKLVYSSNKVCSGYSTSTSTTSTSTTSSSTSTTTQAPINVCNTTYGLLTQTNCDQNGLYGIIIERKSGVIPNNVEYGYSTSTNPNNITNWQSSDFLILQGDGQTVYIYARYDGTIGKCFTLAHTSNVNCGSSTSTTTSSTTTTTIVDTCTNSIEVLGVVTPTNGNTISFNVVGDATEYNWNIRHSDGNVLLKSGFKTRTANPQIITFNDFNFTSDTVYGLNVYKSGCAEGGFYPFRWIAPSTTTTTTSTTTTSSSSTTSTTTIPPIGNISCGNQPFNWQGQKGFHLVNVNLGSATGTVLVNYDSIGVPDRFRGYIDGVEVFNTGFVGMSSYNSQLQQLGYPPVTGPNKGSLTFNKSTNSTNLQVYIDAPIEGTYFTIAVLCPS